jgi:Mrp family chromosome partitioning ATPase
LNSILAVDKEPNLAFQGILHSFYDRLETGEGVAIAFTSASAGEGVSYVSKKIASQLSASSSGSAIYLSSAQLCGDSGPDGASRLNDYPMNEETGSTTAWEDWRSKVTKLRARYRYSIIDCPSLSASSDALSLAPHMDGIVIVVAANDTHKNQIANAERQIQMVNGKILGFLLNKRKYMVPDWLFKRL